MKNMGEPGRDSWTKLRKEKYLGGALQSPDLETLSVHLGCEIPPRLISGLLAGIARLPESALGGVRGARGACILQVESSPVLTRNTQ